MVITLDALLIIVAISHTLGACAGFVRLHKHAPDLIDLFLLPYFLLVCIASIWHLTH